MKKFKLLALSIMFLSFSLIFTGCSFGKSKDKNYSVYFVADESSTEFVKVIETSGNTELDLPVVEKEGYVFDGWYYSSKQSTELFTSTSLISKTLDRDIVVFAKWKAEEYDIVLEVVSDGVFNNQSCGTATINGISKVNNAKVGDSFDLNANAVGSYKFFGWYLSDYVITNVSQLNNSLLISADSNYKLILNNTNFGKQYLYAKFGTGISFDVVYEGNNTQIQLEGNDIDSIKITNEIKNTLGITSNIRRDEENQSLYLVYIFTCKSSNGSYYYKSYFDDELISGESSIDSQTLMDVESIAIHYIKKYFTITFRLEMNQNYSNEYIDYLYNLAKEGKLARNYKEPDYNTLLNLIEFSIEYKFSMETGVLIPYNNLYNGKQVFDTLGKNFIGLKDLVEGKLYTVNQDPYTRGYWSNKIYEIVLG